MSIGVRIFGVSPSQEVIELLTERAGDDVAARNGFHRSEDDTRPLGFEAARCWRYVRVSVGDVYELENAPRGEALTLAELPEPERAQVALLQIVPEGGVVPPHAVHWTGADALADRIAAVQAERAREAQQRDAKKEALIGADIPDEEIRAYFLMRAGSFLGWEGGEWTPWRARMLAEGDAPRDAYLKAMFSALALLPEEQRVVLLCRQISEWGELASTAELEERFARPISEVVALEDAARASLRAAGTAWWASR